MNHGGELSWSFGVDVDRNFFALGIEALVRSATDETGETGKPLGPPERLDVLVENLIGGRRIRTGLLTDFNIVGIARRRSAVLVGQTRGHSRANVAAMTRIAGHLAFSAEVAFVERVHHGDHLACFLFARIVQSKS